MPLNNFDVPAFLKDYWQKKPLLIPAAFTDTNWLEPDDLAGLSLEETVESRIILQDQNTWQVKHGPFDENSYQGLPEKDWTLLVQGVDQWIPELQDIVDCFSFLPRWRFDDIMVSYAPVGGTVSQHYDFFDVFLIQGQGQRRWQLGQQCSSSSELLPDTPVRILKDFSPSQEFILNPGDILYIPAKYAHLGVSLENSLTYSVGFRAPSIRDLADGITTAALESLLEDQRYQDCEQSLEAKPGQIPTAAVNQLQAMLRQAILDKSLIKDWFGKYVTERKYADLDLIASNIDGWFLRLNNGEPLYRHSASRFAYTGQENCTLFVDGQAYKTSLSLAQQLCDNKDIDVEALMALLQNTDNRELLEQLLNNGSLVFNDDEYDHDE